MIIELTGLNGPGAEMRSETTEIDANVGVTITKAFIGPLFISEDGEELGICQRDSGFEISYTHAAGGTEWWSFNNGTVQRLTDPPTEQPQPRPAAASDEADDWLQP